MKIKGAFMVFLRMLMFVSMAVSVCIAQADDPAVVVTEGLPAQNQQDSAQSSAEESEGSLEHMVQAAQSNEPAPTQGPSDQSSPPVEAESNVPSPAPASQTPALPAEEKASGQVEAPPAAPQALAPVTLAPSVELADEKQAQHQEVPAQVAPAQSAETPAVAQKNASTPFNAEPDEGIDTLDVQGGGNWLLKRGWWEQAEKRYEKIKGLVNQVMDARMAFFGKRAELDRNVLDPFYAQIGLDQGKLEETITYLLDEMERGQKKEGVLHEQERALSDVLAVQKKSLEQLILDVQAISKLDNSIDEAIAALNDQVNRARGYENQAWKNFKEISRELSDEKAKEFYYAIDTFYANIGDIYHYIQNDLGTF